MLLKIIKHVLKIIRSAKISIKLTVIYAFMFSLVLLLLNASILYGVKYYMYNQANKQIEDMQTIILNKITLKNEEFDLSSKEILADISSKENVSIRIIQQDGKVINSSEKFDYNIKQSNFNKSLSKEKHIEDKERHLTYKNIKYESKKYGTVYIQIVKDMHNEYEFMKILFVVMAAADFIGVIVSIILGYMVSKKMLKPIDHITKTAENISIKNLKERIEVKEGSDDELKRLASTFNKMIDRLQEAFNRQAQFVSDASHELRTPIAVIQGYANLLDRWGKNDRNALEKSIYGIKLETANMADLVEKLLFLARGDSGTQVIEKKEFWLNELIDEVVKESKIIAQDRSIYSYKNDTVKIFADHKMIKQMLRIFIDNSIKFTSEYEEINISSEVQGKTVKIAVSDTGIGIPENEIKNIFNRFYIVDKSRSKEKGGTGLGLSIAKWIVDMHQGIIKVESEEGKGTKIVVTLDGGK
ncbi:sensor histidine kinase [Clostridium scatologenes]|uniref:histidine kinase n=1 Tax=Clostridium scatologenes TaxID=1548 RepID=A0A0E3JM77_CLOSL|nr:HAMP domain-containing histidine kinase [Clostridium scatologenes]AKA67754.1 two component sensor histidine kinase [Clostridium scatologenes]